MFKHILKPYKKYKDSGVEWIGEIPKNWSVRKLKYICQLKYGNSLEANKRQKGNIPVYGSNGIVDFHNQAITKSPCIIIGRKGSFGKVNFSKTKCFPIDTTYYIDEVDTALYSLEWLMFLLVVSKLDGVSKDTGVPGLNREDAYRKKIPVPPIEKQSRIVKYLNHKSKQAETFIEKQTRLIELLKEQKKTIINKAVTKGLNPDVPMKDSGIEWLGEIPKHWRILKAKYIFKEVDERSQTGSEELLSVSHMTGVTPRAEKNVYMFMAEDYSGSKLCKKRDLVINIMWAWMGALGVSDRTGIVSPSYCVYRQKRNCIFSSWYVEHLLRSIEYVAEYNRRSTGLHSSRLRLYTHMFFDMEISIPPIAEQHEIERNVKIKTAKIDQATQKAEKEIILAKEYLQSLIYHVVIGKLETQKSKNQ